jgi:alkylation response protein AidB-like acyl-CoA dehydrogenase
MQDKALTLESKPHADELLDAARKFAPLLREHAEGVEKNGRLARPVVEALLGAGLFHMAVPRSFGGAEANPLEMIAAVEELGRADASTGWCVSKATCSTLVARGLPQATLAEMFGDRSFIGACVLAPRGKAVAVPGGVKLSGRWSYATTAEDCTWIALGTLVYDGDEVRKMPSGHPLRHLVLLKRADFQVRDTWHVSGLAGSGSHDVEASEVFVPESRLMGLGQRTLMGALYSFPIFALLRVLDAAVALGIGRRAIEEFQALAKQKISPWGGTLGDQVMAQQLLGQAEAMVRGARAFLFDAVGQAWQSLLTTGAATLDHRVLMTLAATEVVARTTTAVDLMYTTGGVTSMMTNHPMQRIFRDIHAVTQDVAVHSKNYEYVGKHLLDQLDLETSLRL